MTFYTNTALYYLQVSRESRLALELFGIDLEGLVLAQLLREIRFAPRVQNAIRIRLVDHVTVNDVQGHSKFTRQLVVIGLFDHALGLHGFVSGL